MKNKFVAKEVFLAKGGAVIGPSALLSVLALSSIVLRDAGSLALPSTQTHKIIRTFLRLVICFAATGFSRSP